MKKGGAEGQRSAPHRTTDDGEIPNTAKDQLRNRSLTQWGDQSELNNPSLI